MKIHNTRAIDSIVNETLEEDLDNDDIDWDDVPEYNNNFAEDIYNCIDSFLDKEDINGSFINKNKVKIHFNKHCLSKPNKKSKRTYVYYDFIDINDYKYYEKQIISGLNSTNLLIINSLGDYENISKSFRAFFEGNRYLLLSSSCGFHKGNKSISILLDAFSSDVTNNYSQNTITIDIFSGNTTYTMYPVDADYLEQKINNIIDKYNSNIQYLKFNNKELETMKEAKQHSALRSNGVYSILQNKWIKEPIQADIPDLDQEAFDKELKIWEDRYSSIYNKATESLTEDITSAKAIIADQIQDEWEAIKNYEQAINDLESSEGSFEDIIKILNDIADEEEVHVGELTQAQATLDNAVLDNINKGHEEAKDLMTKDESLEEEITDPRVIEIEKYLDDIYDLRKTSIAEDGEYSIGNQVFKTLRNKGYLDNLRELKIKLIDKELSLEHLD